MKITEETQIPKGRDFGPFLTAFIKENNIKIEELAKGLKCSVYTIKRFMEGETFPTERAYAEFSLAFILITGKSMKYYLNLEDKDKDKEELVAKIMAGGGSVLSIGAMIALISEVGIVAGLSAAGVTSGLAAIGAIVGGGMVAGLAIIAAVPLLVGGALYWLFSQDKQNLPPFVWDYKDSHNKLWETVVIL